MTQHDIPSDVRRLLHDHVESYEHLEVLLLFGAETSREWAVADLAAGAGLRPEAAVEALTHLTDADLLIRSRRDDLDLYSCLPACRDVLERLAAAHRADRLAVMHVMTSNALERVRTSALRTFASAFLLGKKRDG